jgi:glycosyltransferase involved in cell wall biosynthesis
LSSSPRIAILYSELADYSLACFRALSNQDAEVLLVHWSLNPEAPFQFDLSFVRHLYSRDTLNNESLLKVVSDFDPHLILSSGWLDKGYLRVCRKFQKKIPTVLSMDNHWVGSFKQLMARLVSPFTIRRAYSHAFVPGAIQKEYALKLGFPNEAIMLGFYSADVEKFNGIYEAIKEVKEDRLPHRFLYLGRYVEHKGIYDLWNAFNEVRKDHPNWELWCVGTGAEYENRVKGDGIRHFGFVQPNDLEPILKKTSVYILPSHFEPWGVSVQEMAISGFPLILSDEIGSREAFLRTGENGEVFKAGSVEQLIHSMRLMAAKSDDKLLKMCQNSHNLGNSNSPDIWASSLYSIINLNNL